MIQLEVWGDYALFTRVERKEEPVSYDVLTPSAARGIVEAIYWHPGLVWKIQRIFVLSPIQFMKIQRDKVIEKLSWENVEEEVQGQKNNQQQSITVLQNIHYVIEAKFQMTDQAAPSDNPKKFYGIITRRMKKGQCYHEPYFGWKEFPVKFRMWEGGKIHTISETRELGVMLYDMDYTDLNQIRPTYFRANLKNGVLDLRNVEIYRSFL